MGLLRLAKFLNVIGEGSRYALFYGRDPPCEREGSAFTCNLLLVSSLRCMGRGSRLVGLLPCFHRMLTRLCPGRGRDVWRNRGRDGFGDRLVFCDGLLCVTMLKIRIFCCH